MPQASARKIAWIEWLTWIFIYVGLLLFVLGLATRAQDAAVAAWLVMIGAVMAVAGAALVWVRSRMDANG